MLLLVACLPYALGREHDYMGNSWTKETLDKVEGGVRVAKKNLGISITKRTANGCTGEQDTW